MAAIILSVLCGCAICVRDKREAAAASVVSRQRGTVSAKHATRVLMQRLMTFA